MSEEQLKAFIAKAKDDQSIQEKLKSAKSSEDIVGIAKEAGFSISADDLKQAQSEISGQELEATAGGQCWHSCNITHAMQTNLCASVQICTNYPRCVE